MNQVELFFENDIDADYGFDMIAVAKSVIEKALFLHNISDEVIVSIYMVNGEEIRSINNENRNIDSVTDVLSFPNIPFESEADMSVLDNMDEWDYYDPENNRLILGDIVLCDERILEQAKEYGHSIKREYAFLIAHSILHLLGYDHMEDEERVIMENKQREILEALNITRD